MPAGPGEAAHADAAASRTIRRATTRSLLFVEDNPPDVRLITEMLGEQDMRDLEITFVDCMADAETHLSQRPVDIILLDLGLPDAEGLEGVRRAHATAPGVALVVLTGLDDESLAIRALQEGAQDYLIKGQVDARGLSRALRYAIERKTLQDARTAAESQLLQAQKLESIGRLAGGIAHDFNNMLFVVCGSAELLTQDIGSSDPARLDPRGLMASVDSIVDAAGRATALTGQLLAFSRQRTVTTKVLDLNAVVVSIEPMLRRLIGANTRLTLDLDPVAGHIRADEGQVGQIVVNLVLNARDAMPDGGTVAIETRSTAFEELGAAGTFDVEAGPFTLLSVEDTGVGIDAATREHMFEPFFTTKDVGKGTGLGLATAYGIVRQSGGDIWVDSTVGRGSAIKLCLPRVDAPADERPLVSINAAIGVGRVLVVEDDRAVRDITTQFLERAGYAVVAVADGAEAIAVARSDLPLDVLVADVVMPNMSGIELADRMMDLDPALGVVLLSGYVAEALDLERAVSRGAIFVQKPVTSTQMVDAVIHAAASRRTAAGQP